MVALRETPPTMDLAEFLAWDAPPHSRWQLVDRESRAMALASVPHNIILGTLGALIRNHLNARNSPCIVVPNSGVVPRARSRDNYRIPGGAGGALCSDAVGGRRGCGYGIMIQL